MIISKFNKKGKKKKGNYFLYALGEVTLIVMGILIAIQVDNWRENMANEKTVANYYTLIENDLNDQMFEIEAQVKSELEILRESEKLIESYIKNSGFVTDSEYSSAIGNINNWRTFIKIDPAFEQLLATGDVQLISNQDLKKNTFTYFHQLRKVETIITENHKILESYFAPLMLRVSNHSLPNFQNELYKKIVTLGYVPANIEEILSGMSELDDFIQENVKKDNVKLELYNAIKFRYRISAVHLSYLEDLRSRTELLKKKINLSKK